MRYQCLDEKWTFRRGLLDSLAILQSDPGETVNLPHDGMIGTPVTPDAPAEEPPQDEAAQLEEQPAPQVGFEDAVAQVCALAEEQGVSAAAKAVAAETGYPKGKLYKAALDRRGADESEPD